MIRKSIVNLEDLSFINFNAETIDTETTSEEVTYDVVEEIPEENVPFYTVHYIETVDGITNQKHFNDLGEEVTSFDENLLDFYEVYDTKISLSMNDSEGIMATGSSEVKVKMNEGGNLSAFDNSKFFVDLSKNDNIVFVSWTTGTEFIFNDFAKSDAIQLDSESFAKYSIQYEGNDSIIVIDGEAAITIKNFHFTDDNMFIL